MELPDELRGVVEGYRLERHPWEESGAAIYRLTADGAETLYLKVYPLQGPRRLERETRILRWIGQRLPTPRPLHYTLHGAHEYQLTSEVPGTPCHQLDEGSWEDAVRVMAETLRRIHMLDADGCPITRTASMRIGHLRKSGDSSTLVRLKELEATAPDESPVFTHGDYCLPNIILSGGSLSGVIDWDYAGLADPYTDLEACIWSIKHNYGAAGEELVPFFLWAYGLEEPDMEKLDWYDRLSELE